VSSSSSSSSSSASLSPPPPPSRTPHRARGTSLDSVQAALIHPPSNDNDNSRSLQATSGDSAQSHVFITGAADAAPLIALLVQHLNARGFLCSSAIVTNGDGSSSDDVADSSKGSSSNNNTVSTSAASSNGNGEVVSQPEKSSFYAEQQHRVDQVRSSRCVVAVLSPGIVNLPYTPPVSYDDDNDEVTDPSNAIESKGAYTPTAPEAAAVTAFWGDVSVACAALVPLVAVQLEGSTWWGKARLNPNAAYVPANVPVFGTATAAPAFEGSGSSSSSSGGVGTIEVRPLLDALLGNGPPLGHSTEYLEPFVDRLSQRCVALVGGSGASSGSATGTHVAGAGDGHRNTSKGIRKMLASPENGARQQRKSRTRKQAK